LRTLTRDHDLAAKCRVWALSAKKYAVPGASGEFAALEPSRCWSGVASPVTSAWKISGLHWNTICSASIPLRGKQAALGAHVSRAAPTPGGKHGPLTFSAREARTAGNAASGAEQTGDRPHEIA